MLSLEDVTVTDGDDVEFEVSLDETFTVTLSAPGNATLATGGTTAYVPASEREVTMSYATADDHSGRGRLHER